MNGWPPKHNIGAAAGIGRSLRQYYGDTTRLASMAALYAQFVKPGDLAFDIGAHVGNRVAAFLALGARVVAVEPQPAAFRVLRRLYGQNPYVTLVHAAVSDAPGALTMRLNTANPTVSTASLEFIASADGAPGWEGQRWDAEITVEALTLDQLIRRHGRPSFVKVDVEGLEDKVLSGLSRPLPALSFEFTTIQRDVARACLAELARLGAYRFNAALGESQRLEFSAPVDAGAIASWLDALPLDANSGDIYATLNQMKG
ncbi:MAG: FkbM family methyltransferase [Hyphomicrobiales bacterium]|nr:FkbM family methyltransferase [Hyphomicrobiales bacterium]